MPGETIRLVDPDGTLHDVPLGAAAQALQDPRWKVASHEDQAGRVAAQAREANYGGVGGALKAGGAALARGVTLGGSDVLARAIGGEDSAIALEGYRSENPGVSLGAEIIGGVAPALLSGGAGVVGQAARLTPAGATTVLGRGVSSAMGGGLRGALAAGVTEGAIAGTGTGISELALSRDPLTFERAATTLGSNALFGAAIGGGLGVTANAVERGLHRAGAAIDDYVAKRTAREALAPDLVGLDRKGLKLAEDAELARVEAERVTGRSQIADEIAAFRDELREQKIWLTTKRTATVPAPNGTAPPVPVGAPARGVSDAELPSHMDETEFEAFAEPWRASLDSDVEQAMQIYAANGSFSLINGPLRLGEGLAGVRTAALREIVPILDRGIAAAPAPRDMLTYRGVSGRRSTKEWLDVAPGDVIVDRGFGSTSALSRVGGDYAKGMGVRKGVELRILVPEGYPAAPVPSEIFGAEREILLPRNTKYTVDRVVDGDNGRVVFVKAGPAAEGEASNVAAVARRDAKSVDELTLSELDDRMAKLDGRRQALDRSAEGRDSQEFRDAGDEYERAYQRQRDIKSGKVPEPKPEPVGEEAIAPPASAPEDSAPPQSSPPADPAPTPPQIEGLGSLGKRLLKTDRALDRLLDNPKALASRPQRALDALQMQEAAYEDILDKAAELRIKFAADTSGERLAALDSIPAALERNRALQGRIGEMLQAPRTPRLDAIAEAREILNQPEPPRSFAEQALSGTMFGAIASAASAVPVIGAIPGVAQFIGAKGAEIATRVVFGKMGASVGAQAERAGNIVKGLLDVTTAAKPYAPVVATKVLAALRYGTDKGEEQPTTLPALFKARTDEIKQLTAYDEAGVPRMRSAVRRALADKLRPIAAIDPLMADRLETKIANRIEYLSGIIPRRPDIGGVQAGPDNWHPSDMAMRSWARSAAAAEDPYGVLERAITGTLTPEDAEVMRAVHPEILGDFVNQVMSKLPELRQTLPYHRKLSLSILTGVPVDPAMDPKVLRVLQRQFPDEVGSAGGTQAPKAQPSFGSMKATANQMSSPAQQRSQGAYT